MSKNSGGHSRGVLPPAGIQPIGLQSPIGARTYEDPRTLRRSGLAKELRNGVYPSPLLRKSSDDSVLPPHLSHLKRAAKAGIVNPNWGELTRRRQERREPIMMLCDRVIHHSLAPSEISPTNSAMIKQAVRAAHRVVLDEAAEERVSEVTVQCCDLVCAHETFARQPWDPMWVEMQYGNAATADDRVGLLYKNHDVYSFHYHTDMDLLVCDSIVHHLHQPELKWWFTDTPDRLDHFLLGFYATQIVPDLRATIRANYSESYLWENDHFKHENFNGTDGVLVKILAILLLLNRPGLVRYHAKPGGRTFVSGKSRPYMSHSTLHFLLDPKESLRALANHTRRIQERAPARWHNVRDHYCHSKEWRETGAIGCIHTPIQTDEHWIPAPNLPPLECSHWVCSRCEGRRWRRVVKNGRGSAAVGFVQQDMTVVEGPPP